MNDATPNRRLTMTIQHENGSQVEARVGMKVWVIDFRGSNRGGYVDEIIFFEKDVFGDDCMMLRGGHLCGPNEVIAKWQV